MGMVNLSSGLQAFLKNEMLGMRIRENLKDIHRRGAEVAEKETYYLSGDGDK